MKNLAKTILLLLATVAVFSACTKDDLSPDGPEASEYTKKVNRFIKTAMEDKYLWNDKMPDINYKYESDSKAYFNKLLFTDKDKWSYITDDIQSLLNSFEGIEKSYGWSLAFYNMVDIQKIIAIIEYVYPETPASVAGFKRGDILLQMDGNELTETNYSELLYSNQAAITRGIITENDIVADTTINLVADELTLNPVLKTNVVEHDGRKIGYLFYAQFIENFNSSLDAAFQQFKSQQVTDLVIDLRYNPGGIINAAQYLASCVAPLSAVNNSEILVRLYWNEEWQEKYIKGQIMSPYLERYFNSQVPTKMGLNRIYFLSGESTASASELVITGLKPYMDEVMLVGDTTYGKYTASQTLIPENYPETYSEEIANWGIQPIVLRYANAYGESDFEDGFIPDIFVEDDLFAAFPLGDKNDPLFKAAIEDITGSPVLAMKSAPKISFNYKMIDRGFSRFDANKRQMPIEVIKRSE